MRKMTFKTLAILTIVFLSGCASSYRSINPSFINYTSHDLKDGISLSYKYDVLREKGNRKYARKEDLKGLKIVSVKITNYTDSVINIGKDVSFYSGYKQVFPLEPIIVKNSIKQYTPSYLLYLLLTPLKLFVTTNNSTGIYSTETYPIGYLLGPTLAIGNVAVAWTANSALQKELYDYNILNRDIVKGETVYGIIGLKDVGYNPISIRKIGNFSNTEQDFSDSLQNIEEQITTLIENPIIKIKENLYKTDTSISYQIYYQNILNLSYNSLFEKIEIVKVEYSNGNVKSVGLKAKHKFGDTGEDIYSSIYNFYKIGTWRYFYENGQLKKLVDYDLNENKDGRYLEYDSDGNLKIEKTFKSGKTIKRN